jgi:hypothetical protein
VGRTEERSCAYRDVVERPEGNLILGRYRRRLKDNIKTVL